MIWPACPNLGETNVKAAMEAQGQHAEVRSSMSEDFSHVPKGKPNDWSWHEG